MHYLSVIFYAVAVVAVICGFVSLARWMAHVDGRFDAHRNAIVAQLACITSLQGRVTELENHPWLRKPERLKVVSVTLPEHLADCSINRGETYCNCGPTNGAA